VVGLLPGSPGPAIPPDSPIAENPRYLRVLFLVAILIAVVFYAHAVERRLLRRAPVNVESRVAVVHVVLLVAALLILLVNPFSILLVLPAAVLWPLARRGPWPLSRAPAWAGLTGLLVALLFYALSLDLGANAWWYFFLLVEDRTVPAVAALTGAAIIAGALHLGHHLHDVGAGRWTLKGGPSRPQGHPPQSTDANGTDATKTGATVADDAASRPATSVRRIGPRPAPARRPGPTESLSSRPGRASGR